MLYSISYNMGARYNTAPLFYCHLVVANFTHTLQGYFSGAEAIIRLPQCQETTLNEMGKIGNIRLVNDEFGK